MRYTAELTKLFLKGAIWKRSKKNAGSKVCVEPIAKLIHLLILLASPCPEKVLNTQGGNVHGLRIRITMILVWLQ